MYTNTWLPHTLVFQTPKYRLFLYYRFVSKLSFLRYSSIHQYSSISLSLALSTVHIALHIARTHVAISNSLNVFHCSGQMSRDCLLQVFGQGTWEIKSVYSLPRRDYWSYSREHVAGFLIIFIHQMQKLLGYTIKVCIMHTWVILFV